MPTYDLRPPVGPRPSATNWAKKWNRRHPGPTVEQIADKLNEDEQQGLLDALAHPERMTDARVPFIFRMENGRLVRRGRQIAEFLRDRAP